MASIRKPAVAGRFYPAHPGKLTRLLQTMLNGASQQEAAVPKAIVVPHAGYIYSGQVAASAYARLLPAADRITRVVLLGPCHRVGVLGLALPDADIFRTPLGDIQLDQSAIAAISILPQVVGFADTHEQEHSLEVHLPFLQRILSDFTLVPLVVGQAPPDDVSEVIELLWGGPETLIVLSTDLSHYLSYEQATQKDAETCRSIEALRPEKIDRHGACGHFPLGGLLQIARRRGMAIETLDMCNSGDTGGPRSRVVGYGAWALTEPNSPASRASAGPDKKTEIPASEEDKFEYSTRQLLEFHGEALLRVAARSVLAGLKNGRLARLKIDKCPLPLINPGASFVTLKKNGRLRGCIGSAQAVRPLIEDVFNNAFGAAFRDPRFPALNETELAELSMSVSVLSPQVEVRPDSESDLLAILRPGRDGLVIQDGANRALFLPAVWQQIPDPEDFLARLREKAGLDAGHWSDEFRVWRFIAEEFHAHQLGNPDSLWR